MKSDIEQLSEDIEKNLKFVGKEIFGNTESLLDLSFFLRKLKLNSY